MSMAGRIAADDFLALAAHARLPAINPARAADDEWTAHCRAVWAKGPPWGFDRGFVAELAAEHLPRVLAQMGVARMIGRLSPDTRRIVGRGAPLAAMPLDPAGRWMLLRLAEPQPELLALDSWSHAWRCPALDTIGHDLVDLGAWRWGVSAAKAAFRIARLCGAARPVP